MRDTGSPAGVGKRGIVETPETFSIPNRFQRFHTFVPQNMDKYPTYRLRVDADLLLVLQKAGPSKVRDILRSNLCGTNPETGHEIVAQTAVVAQDNVPFVAQSAVQVVAQTDIVAQTEPGEPLVAQDRFAAMRQATEAKRKSKQAAIEALPANLRQFVG